ncbi:MAG: hypothetical protein A2487_19300 [Candidatus Raymondbacteria bacterium RifOxyC12_full_50_8]|nr:MAG: hypothetical protein A2487_19300 [Candidatus Raymondbacteria bacterium RifOxyC12_full_50_8]
MGKSNKKGLLVIGAIAFVSFLYLQSGDTEWQIPVKSKKQAKTKQKNYQELRKAVFAPADSTVSSTFPKTIPDPFKSIRYGGAKIGGQKAVIKRAYTLKGILIQTPLLAVIVDASGESHIVGKGEHFNGMAVVSIERDRAILKDAYGTFTLIQK